MSGARISYGKLEVPVQCVGVAPLRGLPEIPESPVRALDTGLLACEVSMEVLGQGFLAAYTEGDNRDVVATDTMKNVILRHALEHDGATPEGFLDALGRRFLGTYPEMEGLRLTRARAAVRAGARRRGEERSDRLFSLGGGDHGVAELELARDGDGAIALVAARSGQVGLRLLKTTGSAFTRFARDDATTLPERADRPLFIHLDVHWRYADPADALAGDPSRYVAAAQVRDVVCAVFHEFVSESIQHLVHEMGQRLLARFPALAEVSFARREPHVRPGARARTPARTAGLHGGVPRLGPDHADAHAMTRYPPGVPCWSRRRDGRTLDGAAAAVRPAALFGWADRAGRRAATRIASAGLGGHERRGAPHRSARAGRRRGTRTSASTTPTRPAGARDRGRAASCGRRPLDVAGRRAMACLRRPGRARRFCAVGAAGAPRGRASS